MVVMEFNPSRRLFLRSSGLASVAPIVAPILPFERIIKYFFAPVGGWSGNKLLTTQMITAECLRILKANLVFTASVNRDFDRLFSADNEGRIRPQINLKLPLSYHGIPNISAL